MAKRIIQRALVLQGGGSLGAYEAGVFEVLYYWIKKDTDDNENVFNVVAGTSIGAINGAFLVSYVIKRLRKNKNVGESWKGSAEALEEFWKSRLASNINLNKWWPYSWDEKSWTLAWDLLSSTNSFAATGEAARRYYSAKESIISGASNVFLPILPPKIDLKFFDNFIVPNIWYRYDNNRLKETIKSAIGFPIGTSHADMEPRLLAISVDAEEGETVTFDSYVKDKDTKTRKSEYGDIIPGIKGEKGTTYERTIKYDKGIMVEHILASASVPEHYDFTLVPKEYYYTTTEEEKSVNIENNNLENYIRFWDGGVLSNTPLRELIQSHQDYWKLVDKIDSKGTIPDLEVYVIDIWPSVDGYPVPSDLDGIRNRKYDLTYQDVTPYDEKVANIISDYYNLVSRLRELAAIAIEGIGDIKKKEDLSKRLVSVMKTKAKSSHRTGGLRTYSDLVDKRFDITKVIRIERSADKNDIANKWCDFSLETISKLFEQGTLDALKTIVKERMISECIQLDTLGKDITKEIMISECIQSAFLQLHLFMRYAKKEGANYDLIQSAESVEAMLPILKDQLVHELDLIQSAESVKAMLPILIDQLIREGSINPRPPT